MQPIALEASPIAKSLISLAERAATGYINLGRRRVVISSGDVVGVHPADGDESLEQFLFDSSLIDEGALSRAQVEADEQGIHIAQVLVRDGLLRERDLLSARRSLWLDRFVRSFRELRCSGEHPLRLEPGDPLPVGLPGVRLVPLLLDALARCATEEDAEAVGVRLNHRLEWLQRASTETGRKWAALGSLPERPTVSSILVRAPAAATSIAALERAGLIFLAAPGSAPTASDAARLTMPSFPARKSTLPPPSIPCFPDLSATDAAEQPAGRPLDGGGAGRVEGVPSIPTTELRRYSLQASPFDDPVFTAEERVAFLDGEAAPANDRAKALCDLGRAWESSVGAIEEAARAYGDATAADPYLEEAPRQASRLCMAIGDADSALAYARVSAVTASAGSQRARALRRVAAFARCAGDLDACLDALCEAAAEDESDVAPHEQVAGILAERGDSEGAVAHLRAAARALEATEPERTRSLRARAYALRPDDTDLVLEYFRALQSTGRGVAAVALLGDVAGREASGDRRRDLRLRAALLAEEYARPDLAADLLLEAFDEDPQVELLHDPLYENLKASGTPEEVAVLSEQVARRRTLEQTALWYRRAGEAALGIRDAHERALLLLAEAVEHAPPFSEALELLERHSVSFNDQVILVDCLQKASEAVAASDPPASLDLLARSAMVAEEKLGAILYALATWQRIVEIDPEHVASRKNIERLAGKSRMRQALTESIEGELQEAGPGERIGVLVRLAPLLLDLPSDRPRAIEVYREIASAKPDDPSVFSTLLCLMTVARRRGELPSLLQARIAATPDRQAKKRLLTILASIRAELGDPRGAADTCIASLSIAPGNPEVLARLERLAAELGDLSLLCDARKQKVDLSRTAVGRGLALVRLARVLEASTRFDEAVAAADAALVADPTSAEASLLLLRHAHRLPPDRSVVILGVVRSALGDSSPLLELEAKAARAARDEDAYLRALESWNLVSPLDGEPVREILRLKTEQGRDPVAIAEAAGRLLDPELLDGTAGEEIEKALEKLSELGTHDRAFELAARALDALGKGCFATLLLREARAVGDHAHTILALERTLPFLDSSGRRETLHDLRKLHLARNDRAGELNALLRLIALDPEDIDILDRLAVLYAENGKIERLLSVLSLATSASSEPNQKRQKMLDLAAAYAYAASDLLHAEECIRAIVIDFPFDERWTLEALGAFFSLGDRRWAFEKILALAREAPAEIGASIFRWAAATVESEMSDPSGALQICLHGLDLFPHHAGLVQSMERYAAETRDIDTAIETYERLAERAMGNHGRRSLYYRAARWLEGIERDDLALAYYGKAFRLAPSRGVLFNAIERLSARIDPPLVLIEAYEALARSTGSPIKRAALLHSAARLHLDRADGAHGAYKAAELLAEAWEAAASDPIAESLREAAARLKGVDDAVADSLLAGLSDRAEQNDSVLAGNGIGLDNGVDSVTSGATKEREQAGGGLQNDTDEWRDFADSVESQSEAGTSASSAVPASSPPGFSESAPFEATAGNDAAPDGDAQNQAEAAHRYRTLVREQPSNTEAVRNLYGSLSLSGARVEAGSASEVLSVFDASVETTERPVFLPGICPASEIQATIEPPGEQKRHRLLELVWEAVRTIPRFTRTLQRHGIDNGDRLPVGATDPLASAYARASALLQADVPLFLKDEGELMPLVAATNPPALIASLRMQGEQALDMSFVFGRCLWLARPQNVLSATLPVNEMQLLLDAVWAAFAPVSSYGEVSQVSKQVASDLWQAMPAVAQREVRTLLEEGSISADATILSENVRAAAARSGLLCSGSVRAALLSLSVLDSSLKGIEVETEAGFQAACRASLEFAEVVRFAFSSGYLAIRALA